jgi:hypothetical protein
MEHIVRLGPILVPIVAIIVGGAIAVVVLILRHNDNRQDPTRETPTPADSNDRSVSVTAIYRQLQTGFPFDQHDDLLNLKGTVLPNCCN